MGLWDCDEEDIWENEEVLEDEKGNKYIENPEEAMKLLKYLLSSTENQSLKVYLTKINKLLEEDLLDVIKYIDVDLSLYKKLLKAKSKIGESITSKKMKNKSVIGVGGMFSSGKSKFINSVLGSVILPENQIPTTAIPTYILYSDDDSFTAHTEGGETVSLEVESLEAISHIFSERYKINLADIIKKIVVGNRNLKYKNIVLLDTPGYSKYDGSKEEESTDKFVAIKHLQAVDYLVWLMDIENGVITYEDINFIKSLELDTPVLFVFTKADKKIESDISLILAETKTILEDSNLNIAGITAYSSRENKEYFDNKYIEIFLENMNQQSSSIDIFSEIRTILDEYEQKILFGKYKYESMVTYMKCTITESYDLNAIEELFKVYRSLVIKKRKHEVAMENFNKVKGEVISLLSKI